MVNNIIINTVVPVLFAYGNYHNENKYKEKHCNAWKKQGQKRIQLQRDFSS